MCVAVANERLESWNLTSGRESANSNAERGPLLKSTPIRVWDKIKPPGRYVCLTAIVWAAKRTAWTLWCSLPGWLIFL